MRRVIISLLAVALWSPGASAARVALVAEPGLAGPAAYGLARLEAALQAKGHTVERVAAAEARRADYILEAGVCLKGRPAESLSVHRHTNAGKPAVALCGADARGLMYAALDTAARVGWSGAAGPFEFVREAAESPLLRQRGVSMYTMQRALFESRLYDQAQWRRYFDLLAESRINRFVVIFGYENGGFMAPLYPYFFNVEQFPGVTLVGITAAEQQRNVEAFRAMIRIAHERGITVSTGIWDHIYRGGVQGGGIEGASALAGKRTPGLVDGVTTENLAPYTLAALRKFLDVFPELDALQFRMHDESGLKEDEMAGFWHEVFSQIKRTHPEMEVDIRAKGLPDSIIDDGLSRGLRLRVTTKHWMEQMGLPFHPTHINPQNQKDRRHGYADLLRYPQRYHVVWRLWSGGTTRLLTWGDPEYVRRFVDNARLYDGDSMEVNEMLATKMLGAPHTMAPTAIHAALYRHYDYEFERYWHFYQLWGRLGYNPRTAPETWEREFARRVGAAAQPLMNGLHLASRVLPRIVAASSPYSHFPTTRGWAEMQRMGDLPQYAAGHSTDTEQFQSARERAADILAGRRSTLRTPEESSRWFAALSTQILAEAAKVQAPKGEAAALAADLNILARLAEYHSHRLRAAVAYSLWDRSKDRTALDEAIAGERQAVAAWERTVAAAGDVYAKELHFGVQRVGFPRHWSEELEKLRRGLAALEQTRAQAAPGAPVARGAAATGPPPVVKLPPPVAARSGQDYTVTVQIASGEVESLRLRYRHLTQFEDYESAALTPAGKPGVYQARIPGAFIVPRWDLIYFVEAQGKNGSGRNYPDLEVEAPYVIVPVAR